MSATISIFAPKSGENHCEVVDRLPMALRGVVHDYGYSVVQAFYEAGVRDPRLIRHLIMSVWRGAREPGNRRPGATSTAARTMATLDTILTSLGAGFPARSVMLQMRNYGFTLAPIHGPSESMVAASMTTVANHDIKTTKKEKHRLRLVAALQAADADLWRPS